MALAFVAVLWLIQLSADALDIDLVKFGIYPRRIGGLLGTAFAPLAGAPRSPAPRFRERRWH